MSCEQRSKCLKKSYCQRSKCYKIIKRRPRECHNKKVQPIQEEKKPPQNRNHKTTCKKVMWSKIKMQYRVWSKIKMLQSHMVKDQNAKRSYGQR